MNKSYLFFFLWLIFISFSNSLHLNLHHSVFSHQRQHQNVDPEYSDGMRQSQWNNFKKRHNKEYSSSDDDLQRFKYWLNSQKEIESFNGTWKVSTNEFSDKSPDEKRKNYLNINIDPKSERMSPPLPTDIDLPAIPTILNEESATPPTSVDWRAKGKVTPVKNQGNCGSCWAFGSVAVLESLNLILNNSATNASSNYSAQQLVDCNTWNYGCNGGDPTLAINWGYFNGTASESSYPYYSGVNSQYTPVAAACSRLSTSNRSFGANIVKEYDLTGLMNQVALRPITVLVYADYWFNYAGGVFSNCTNATGNAPGSGDHIVELVGYNSSVWIIKNSWGTNWGDKGFMYLDRTNPLCGAMISIYATYPLMAKPTSNIDPYCTYYAKSYCTDYRYINYMLPNCFIRCGY